MIELDVRRFFDANLQKADLRGANLQKAHLWDADLQEAVLRGADLQMASLVGANLQEADLSIANLLGVRMSTTTNLVNVRLEGARGLSPHLARSLEEQAAETQQVGPVPTLTPVANSLSLERSKA